MYTWTFNYTYVHSYMQGHIFTCLHTHTHALTHIQTHIHSSSLGCDDLGLQNPEQFLVTLDTGPRLVRPHYRASRATTALRSPQNWPGGAQVVVGLSKLEATKVSGSGAPSVCLS